MYDDMSNPQTTETTTMPRTATKTKLAPSIEHFLPNVSVSRKVHVNGRRRERSHPPANESARDRFIRIGSKRMKNLLRELRLIGNLSSANYEVSPRDIQVMQRTVVHAVDDTFSRFAKQPSRKLEDTFALGS